MLLHLIRLFIEQVGDESYESYTAERDGILSSLARRAKVLFYTWHILFSLLSFIECLHEAILNFVFRHLKMH